MYPYQAVSGYARLCNKKGGTETFGIAEIHQACVALGLSVDCIKERTFLSVNRCSVI